MRVNLGYHHFYDKNCKWYGNTQEKLKGGTNEYLGGAEWDVTKRLTISAGGQLTRYQLTDEYMNEHLVKAFIGATKEELDAFGGYGTWIDRIDADTVTGATVSSSNMQSMLKSLFEYHVNKYYK